MGEVTELLARRGAATEPDRELDATIALAAGWTRHHGQYEWMKPNGFFSTVGCPAYTASIDAALTLVPEGWRMAALCQRDPWFCRLETDDFESVTWGKGGDWITEVTSGNEATANAPTPALAIVIAALRAKGVINE